MLISGLVAIAVAVPVLAVEQEIIVGCLSQCNKKTIRVMWEASANFLALSKSYAGVLFWRI